MQPKFDNMTRAVQAIRNRVEEAFNAGKNFTRRDNNTDQYKICCTFSDLTENPNFPNVSRENAIKLCIFFQNKGFFVQLDETEQLNRITSHT